MAEAVQIETHHQMRAIIFARGAWRKAAWLLLAACCTWLWGTPSSAATVYDVTVTGTVISGTDGAGAFGVEGAGLTGDTFTMLFSYEVTSDWQRFTANGYDILTADLASAKMIGTSLSIDGKQLSLGPMFSFEVQKNPSVPPGEFTIGGSGEGSAIDIVYVGDGLPGLVTTPFTSTCATLTSCSGPSDFSWTDPTTGLTTSGQLNTASVAMNITDHVDAPIPEPATWELLLAGLGAMTLLFRRAAFTAG
jgi:hypothetical protein